MEITMALVTTTEMFKKAYEGKYAIGAFNINNMEIIQAITEAAGELRSPVILQVSAGARKYAKQEYLMALAHAAIKDSGIDLALHLDHGADFEICKACIDGGFTSVMIDGSHHSFDDNVAVTRKVVEYAHERGVVVEGELGRLAGVEDDVKVSAEDSSYTRPEEVEEFLYRTGVDSLAIAIGTSHGAYKFRPEQCTRNEDGVLVPPPLRFDILEEIMEKIPGFPIVLHGASSVSQAHVKEINALGGKLPDAVGIPEEQLRKAATLAVCKINIDSDIRLAMTAGIRRVLAAQPEVFDPRAYLSVAREEVKKMVAHKIRDVLGSENTL
jgi:fructose-bisphosphate aldolase class II